MPFLVVRQGVCGGHWVVAGGKATLAVDSSFENCTDLRQATAEHGAHFVLLIGDGTYQAPARVPAEALADPAAVVASAVALARKHNFSGYNIDDESECAPRSTLKNLTRWVGFMDSFAAGLHKAGLTLTADVQAVFGVEDGEYKKTAPCQKAPMDYRPDSRVVRMLAASAVDRWMAMDTCECSSFSFSTFLTAFPQCSLLSLPFKFPDAHHATPRGVHFPMPFKFHQRAINHARQRRRRPRRQPRHTTPHHDDSVDEVCCMRRLLRAVALPGCIGLVRIL